MKIYLIEETSKGLAERYFWGEEKGWRTLPEAKIYTRLDKATKVARDFLARHPAKNLKVICYVLTEEPLP